MIAYATAVATQSPTGKVTDSATGEPVRGAVLAVAGVDGVRFTPSRRTGYYARFLAPGRHEVTASAPGYYPQTGTTDAGARLDISLRRMEDAAGAVPATEDGGVGGGGGGGGGGARGGPNPKPGSAVRAARLSVRAALVAGSSSSASRGGCGGGRRVVGVEVAQAEEGETRRASRGDAALRRPDRRLTTAGGSTGRS